MKTYNQDGSLYVFPVDDAITRIKHFLEAWGIGVDHLTFRFPGEFEKYFKYATHGDAFAMTIEGEFGWLLDSLGEKGEPDFDQIWRVFVGSLGYHVERGNSWSWHFMPLPTFDNSQSR